ncbi:MAG: PHP domain-containing protein, partial [Eubacteriales bacterium]|nr:PHP domain-containing protein [Eubacteriales bacterium]
MEDKIFSVVFAKLKLSATVKTILRNTYVSSIKVNSQKSFISISLISNKILNETCFEDFEEDIRENFKGIENVKIALKYNLDNISNEEKIEKIWGNILTMIKNTSPICFPIIKEATFKLENNTLNIYLPKTGAFIFKVKKIDLYIANLLEERFGMKCIVKFNEPILEKGTNQNKDELSALISKALEESKNMPIEREEQENYVPQINKFRRTKRVSLKIKEIEESTREIKGSINDGEKITIKGRIFNFDITETRTGKAIVKVDITDMTDSVSFKFFTTPDDFNEDYKSIIKKGNFVIVKGEVRYDEYVKELILMPNEICETEPPELKKDECEEKRVELHLHTQMSKMDAVSSVKDLIKRASDWGHKAIAITDHAVVQAFPDAMDIAKKLGIKVLYGVEAYLVDDLTDIAQNIKGQNLLDEFVVFDLETTGLNREINKIIEIGAVKVKNGEIIDRFSAFINPNEKLSEEIINLTKITDEMLEDAEDESIVVPKFFEFFKDAVLVAHNAKFDMGFIKKWAERNGRTVTNTVLDTVGVSRTLFPEMTKHTLNVLAKKLNVSLENHHRAVDDAEATAHIFVKCIEIFKNDHNVTDLEGINNLARTNIDVKKLRPNHAIILVKNQEGLRNLYELISKSNLEYFFRDPRIPKSEFLKLREGLIIGTACENGEFYSAVLNNADEDEIERLADFYDYFEIQPIGNNRFLIKNEKVQNINSDEDLQEINKKIIAYG